MKAGSTEESRSIVAFGPHPDDIELFCGGTLIKMAEMGCNVILIDLTRGELSSGGTIVTREKEAEKAAGILGAVHRENLQIEDGNIGVTKENKDKIVRVVRKYRPELVLVPYPKDRHPDHYHAGTLIYDGIFHSGLRKYRTGQDHFRPPKLIYYMLWEEFPHSFVVDISDQYEKKMQAIQAYDSQFNPQSKLAAPTRLTSDKFEWQIISRMRYYGSLIGKSYGEAFLIQGTLEATVPSDLLFTSF